MSFAQDRGAHLDPETSLRRTLCPEGDSVLYRGCPIHVAGWAKRFLFRDDQLETPVGRLSGGERARVMIARLMLAPADVLLLDEPTNDLDIPTLEVLEDSLLDFPGAMVLVSHDRYLLDRVSTIVIGLDGGRAASLPIIPSGRRCAASRRAGRPAVKDHAGSGDGRAEEEALLPGTARVGRHGGEDSGSRTELAASQREQEARIGRQGLAEAYEKMQAVQRRVEDCTRVGRNWKHWLPSEPLNEPLSGSQRGKIPHHQRMRAAWQMAGLRHEQRSQEKRMGSQFNDLRFTILIPAGDRQSMLLQLIPILRIQSEVAVEPLHRSGALARRGSLTSRLDGHLHGLSNQRTTERSDEQTGCVRVRLGVHCGVSGMISRIGRGVSSTTRLRTASVLLARNGGLTAADRVEHAAEAEHLGPVVEFVRAGLFRGHVHRRSPRQPLLIASSWRRRPLGPAQSR